MTRRFPILRRLLQDCGGSMVVEFALIAPVFLTMMFGVIQVGVALQEYNALRAIAGEVQRYAVVNYQANNKLSTETLVTYGTSVARSSPYNLKAEGLLITVTTPATQRVTGATELNFTIRAQVNNMMTFVNFNDFYITYSRPIFLLT